MNRVEELLRSMTWDEKLAQMQVVFRPDPAELDRWVRAGVGATFWPRSAAAVNALQRIAVEQTRLGIPLLIGLDVIHGQRTIAPTPLAMAASFDPAIVEDCARLAAEEAASGGVNWTFSPMIDVSRDPRWGRVAEGFGEDPYLTAVMGAAMICGYQGDDLGALGSIAAAAKHFVGYGHAEGGRDYNTADMSEHRLRNVYLEPFRAATAAEERRHSSRHSVRPGTADGSVRDINRPSRRLDAEFRGACRFDRRRAEEQVPARGVHDRTGGRLLRRRSGGPGGSRDGCGRPRSRARVRRRAIGPVRGGGLAQ